MATMEEKGLFTLEKPPSSHMASSRLHNFIFPSTPNLSWGTVRLLRCMKEPIFDGGESGGLIKEAPSTSEVQPISPPKEPENVELPWNLRRRRAFSKGESSKPVAGSSRKEKRKLSIPLSFKEIEADFLLMTRKKPHKRPKKRPRHVQKEIDALTPGLQLSVVTFDMYKVVE